MREGSGTRPIELLGGSIVFKASGGDLDLAELTCEPGFAPTPHIHRVHREVFYVLSGDVEFLVGDETIRVAPGGVVDVPPGTLHDFCNVGATPARILGIVSPGGLERYFEEMEEQVVAGTLDHATLATLRDRYDTEDVNLVWRPAISRM